MHILHIDSSPRAHSHSRRLSVALVGRLHQQHPQATVLHRDLGREPLPHATAGYADMLGAAARGAGGDGSALALSECLIQEIEAADVLVIGTPMNNFSVPSVLKAWIDQVLRVGRSIGVAADGRKSGLLPDKPVYVAIASGGVFFGEHARQPDFLTPYLRAALGCVGLHSLQFFPLQATAFRDEAELARECDSLVATMKRVPTGP